MIQTAENIAFESMEISNGLNAKKLILNISKNVEMSIGSSASSFLLHNYSISNSITSAPANCKYLGIKIDSEVSFQSHVDSVVEKHEKQWNCMSA